MAEVRVKIPEVIEEDGIVYFKQPYEVKGLKFSTEHLDCISIVLEQPEYTGTEYIVCYTTNKRHNNRLRQIYNDKYKGKGFELFRHVASSEVNCIELLY